MIGYKRQREAEEDRLQQNAALNKFSCPCGVDIMDFKLLSQHKDACLLMKDKYGAFFDEYLKHVQLAVESKSLDDWTNLKNFYEYFKSKFVQGI